MMTPRFNLIGVFAISLLCILLIFASQRFASNSYYVTEYYKPGDKQGYRLSRSNKHLATHNSNKNFESTVPTYNMTVTIADILNAQRQKIVEEMEFFAYPRDSENLAALTPETNGIPFRSVIITTWRSGSTFLGDILNAMPGNYYHYEPLLDFDIVQIRGAPHANRAIYNLEELLKCNYTDMKNYLDFGIEHNYLFTHNTRLWNYCRLYPQHCWDPNFLTPFCKLFPLQSMKKEKICKSVLIQHIADSQLEYIKDKSMAKDIYDALKSVFERNSVAGQLLLRKQLCTLKYDGIGDIRKHLLEFDNIIRELKGIGAKLEEIDVICQLLLTLPQSYDSLVTSLETLHPESLNIEFVKKRLLDEHGKRSVENKNGISNNGHFSTAMNTFRFQCHSCGKVGHKKWQCPDLNTHSNGNGNVSYWQGFNNGNGNGNYNGNSNVNKTPMNNQAGANLSEARADRCNL